MPPADAVPITLVTAAMLAKNLTIITGIKNITVKWPNDLLINNKKVCGILTELKGEADMVQTIIVGIGININHSQHDFPPEIREKATSLFIETSRYHDRTKLLLSLGQSLKKAYFDFNQNGFSQFRDLWKEYSSTLGQEVIVSQINKEIRGKAVDINNEGSLMLTDQQGQTTSIRQGEVTILAKH